jgi:hypothetical protein
MQVRSPAAAATTKKRHKKLPRGKLQQIKQESKADVGNPLLDGKPNLRSTAPTTADFFFPSEEEMLTSCSVDDPLNGKRKLGSYTMFGCKTVLTEDAHVVIKTHKAMEEAWPTRANYPPMDPVQKAITANWNYALHFPHKVKLLLIAESHASTHESIYGAKCITSPEGIPCVPKHMGHLSLVHCLTYGEVDVLDLEECEDAVPAAVLASAKAGTNTFWKMLATCAGMVDLPTPGAGSGNDASDPLNGPNPFKALSKKSHKSTKDADQLRKNALERIHKKAYILRKLTERGIVLIDLSPVAIYVGGGGNTTKCYNQTTGKPYHTKKDSLQAHEKIALLRAAWENYGSEVIKKRQPENVIIFGAAVMKGIGGESVLEACLKKHKGSSLGYLYHPSSTQVGARDHMNVYLRFLREVCHRVALSPDGKPCTLPKQLVAEPIRNEIKRLVDAKKAAKKAAEAAELGSTSVIKKESKKVTKKTKETPTTEVIRN